MDGRNLYRIYDRVIIDESKKQVIIKMLENSSGGEAWWIPYDAIDWSKSSQMSSDDDGAVLYLK